MDWILRGPQIYSTFSNLGNVYADGYHVNENCNSALEAILQNLLAEDKNLRNYRRNISFGQNVQRDLIPLLIHAKEDKTVDLIIRILVNLTVPIENLLEPEVISKTDLGRHTIFEIHNLLASTKTAFTDLRTTKVVIDFLKKNINVEPKKKLSEEQLNNASNCLLLLRNILHIPEQNGYFHTICNGSNHFVQNQIIWNLFSQTIDKVIIKATTISNSKVYGVTMVQLLALLYKDQHILTIYHFLNNWHETSLSESSEDNESNTSTTDRGSDDSSPITSSDPTSDSSDSSGPHSKGVSATSADGWKNSPGDDSGALDDNNLPFETCGQDIMGDDKFNLSQNNYQDNSICDDTSAEAISEDHIKMECEITDLENLNDRVAQNKKRKIISETSDGGYGTQIENQEFVSSSSNDDDLPPKKPVHKKPHNANQWPNNKPRLSTTLQERKRKKIFKRLKSKVINVQGLSHKTPADDDITKVLQEFTVDFLIKGYNSLVETLHNEIITNRELEMDTSHFFWLVAYFLKFATQMELNLELIDSVLCFDIISYLVAEAVNLCEQFELAIKLDGSDLCPILRRQHLVVTSIREFVEAIELYKKIQVTNKADYGMLQKLQIKMAETEDLSSLLVLLLRHYNPRYHSKQYLEDLVVTNHILLTFLDNVSKIPEYDCSTKMIDHIRQFATPAIMSRYGLLLEDFNINGEFVNDCIFTLMHHVGGDGACLDTLFQPNILKIFLAILKSECEICADWTDLIQYVIHTVVRKPDNLSFDALFLNENEKDNKLLSKIADAKKSDSKKTVQYISKISNNNTALQTAVNTPQERWTEDEISTLSWNYLQCSTNPDVIGTITKQLKEENINKSRASVIRELFRQNLITKDFHESQLKGDGDKNTTTVSLSKESCDEEIRKACEQLVFDGKSPGLEWVQKILLEICYAKLHRQRKELQQSTTPVDLETKFKNFECFKNKHDDIPVVSPVVYHYLMRQKPVPLVPWNCQQGNISKDLKFLQLLDKLGFQMPIDTGRVFIQIPHFWTAEFIYTVAGKIRPIDTSMLKFSVCELSNSENSITTEYHTSSVIKDGPFVESSDNLYQLHKRNFATMVNFTPRPASTYTSANAIEQLNWLQIVQKSQQCKLTLSLKRANEATTEDVINKLPFGDSGSTSVLKSQVTATNTAGLATPLMQPSTSMLLSTKSVLMPSTPVMLPTTSLIQLNTSLMPTRSEMMCTTCVMQPTTSVTLPSTPVMPPATSVMQPNTSVLPTRSDTMFTTCVMQPSTSVMEPKTCVVLPIISAKVATSSVMQRTLSITQETAPDNVERQDCCNSAYETASVASDLTCMYVSDGEGKSEGIARKHIKSGKRRRVLIKRIKCHALPTTVGSEN